jgi:hypothetical protein
LCSSAARQSIPATASESIFGNLDVPMAHQSTPVPAPWKEERAPVRKKRRK